MENLEYAKRLKRKITWEPDGRGRAVDIAADGALVGRESRSGIVRLVASRSATSGRQPGSSSGRRPPSSHYCARPWRCWPSRAASPSSTGPTPSRWAVASSRDTWPARQCRNLSGGTAPARHQRDNRDREGPGTPARSQRLRDPGGRLRTRGGGRLRISMRLLAAYTSTSDEAALIAIDEGLSVPSER